MSGRILSFAKSPHQKVQELLPWFLNGTLESEDVAQVEEHLQSCPACRTELGCLQVLRSTYIDTELAPDAEAALARLRPRLEERAPASRPRYTGERSRARPAQIPSWLGLALAAQFALILGLGWKVLQPDRAALEFHTLSSAATAEHAAVRARAGRRRSAFRSSDERPGRAHSARPRAARAGALRAATASAGPRRGPDRLPTLTRAARAP